MQDTVQDGGQDGGQDRIQMLLGYCSIPRSRDKMQHFCGIASRNCFRTKILRPMLDSKQLNLLFLSFHIVMIPLEFNQLSSLSISSILISESSVFVRLKSVPSKQEL